ncbi:MAG: alpha/beta hydrolase [Lachnospiraceae bacterium]|nr:alpha/beta hydrolase [Lachnospiraceae bacterium]
MRPYAKNLTMKIASSELDYVRFGKGDKTLIMIPGLTLKGVKGSALILAYMYRIFAQDYTVYVFDKKSNIPDGYTVRELANDVALAMNMLNIQNADVFGTSQGGMIAQYLAIDHPHMVHKLVLGVTASRKNETMENTIHRWIEMTDRNDFKALVIDVFKKMYSKSYIKKYKWLFPLLAVLGKPKDPSRFINLAKACLTCNAYPELNKISCPVFVIGGSQDKIVTGQASYEIADRLNCEIYMYDDLGHAAYEEAKDFNDRIYRFLKG